jgi:hypothetical protein
MRRFFITLLMVTGYAFTALGQNCITSPERQAFNAIALKSYLMVAALSCDADPEYNQFMVVFQPFITSEQHVMDAYFQRADGPAGQAQEDGYVTQLANSQSEASQQEGAQYCGQVANLYGAVLNLNTTSDLTGFLSVNPPPQPIAMNGCMPGAAIVPPPAPAPAPKLQTAAEALPKAPRVVNYGPSLDPPAPAAVPPRITAQAGPISQDTAAKVASIAARSLYRAQPLNPPPGAQAAAFQRQPRTRLAMTSRTHHVEHAASKAKPKPSPFMQTQVI